MKNEPISLHPRTIALVLGRIAAALLVLSVIGQVMIFVLDWPVEFVARQFDVGRERNLPTSFTVMLLTCTAVLLVLAAQMSRRQGDRETGKWALLAAGFFVMAYDEGFQVHELLIAPVQSLLGGRGPGAFHYAWVIPGMILVALLGLYFLRFLLRLPSRTRNLFVLSGAMYVGGCIGMELVGSHYDVNYGYENLTYQLIATVEEGLEMAGLILFLYALLGHMGRAFPEARFRVTR